MTTPIAESPIVAHFLLSAPTLSTAPLDHGQEVAFAGRSNSGKSSTINAVTGRRALAVASKNPGRTRTLNFFTIDTHRRLVDLPGYGYAAASQQVTCHWPHLIVQYLQKRKSLKGLVLIMDIRHPLRQSDLDLIAICHDAGIPMHITLNKADKLGHGAGRQILLHTERSLQQVAPDSTIQITSSRTGTGIAELRSRIRAWLAINNNDHTIPGGSL